MNNIAIANRLGKRPVSAQSQSGGGVVVNSALVFDVSSRDGSATYDFDSANILGLTPSTGKVTVASLSLDHRSTAGVGNEVLISGVTESGTGRSWNGLQTVGSQQTDGPILSGGPFKTADSFAGATITSTTAIGSINNQYSAILSGPKTNLFYNPILRSVSTGHFTPPGTRDGYNVLAADGADDGFDWLDASSWAEITMIAVSPDPFAPGAINDGQTFITIEMQSGVEVYFYGYSGSSGIRTFFRYDGGGLTRSLYAPWGEPLVHIARLKYNGTNYDPDAMIYSATTGLLGRDSGTEANVGVTSLDTVTPVDVVRLFRPPGSPEDESGTARILVYSRALTDEELTAISAALIADPFAEDF